MENAKRTNTGKAPADFAVRIFDAELLGRSLRNVGADVLEGDSTDFVSRWFHSSEGEADLVVWTDDKNRVIKLQICVYGQVTEWNPIHGTRTGFVFEQELPGSTETSEIIRYDRVSQKENIVQAIAILRFCPEIGEALRETLISNLRHSPKMHKRTRERAMKEWAPKIDEIVSDQAPTFWKRLKLWVLGE